MTDKPGTATGRKRSLPMFAPATIATPEPSPTILQWERRALLLARATILWNVVEGLIAMGFGASESSVALFGFGVDSWVEVASAGVVYWKLTRPKGCAITARAQERVATRWISAGFLALATGTALGALAQLASGGHPASSVPGIAVGLVSLSLMGFLWWGKRAAARALNSRTLAMDAACSLACIQLSAILFVGSVVFAAWPSLWFADAAAAVGLAGLIAREGWQGWSATGKADFDGGCGCA